MSGRRAGRSAPSSRAPKRSARGEQGRHQVRSLKGSRERRQRERPLEVQIQRQIVQAAPVTAVAAQNIDDTVGPAMAVAMAAQLLARNASGEAVNDAAKQNETLAAMLLMAAHGRIASSDTEECK